MKRTAVQWCTASFLALSISPLSAQCYQAENGDIIQSDGTPCANTIITAVPFLRIVPDARFGALGDAGLALSPDPNTLHFNASNLAFAEKDLGVSATFTPWLRALGLNDVFLAYVSSYLVLEGKAKRAEDRRMQTLGMGLRFFSLGQIQYTDEQGNALQTVKPRELELTFAYARKLGKRFSIGLGTKYIYSNLGNGTGVTEPMRPAHAFAADISFTYRQPIKIGETNNSLNFGMAFNNIGNKISYTRSANRDYIPANFGIGTAFEYNIDKHNSLAIALDINKLLVPTPVPARLDTDSDGDGKADVNPDYDADGDGIADYKQLSVPAALFSSFGDAPGGVREEFRELMISTGIEYWYNKLFALRAGYYYEDKRKGARQFLTVGMGIRYNIFNLNFSYLIPSFGAQRNPLDNTLRFSLLFEFSKIRKDKAVTPPVENSSSGG